MPEFLGSLRFGWLNKKAAKANQTKKVEFHGTKLGPDSESCCLFAV